MEYPICFPGVPRELKELFVQEIIPILPPQTNPPLSIGCFGTGESGLMELIKDIPQPISYRSSRMGIRVTFYAKLNDHNKYHQRIYLPIYTHGGTAACQKPLASYLFREEKRYPLQKAVLPVPLQHSSLLFQEPVGIFWKERQYIPMRPKCEHVVFLAHVLEEHGAVSEPVAIALAQGMRTYAQSTWSLSVTGIAGPGRRK